MEEKKPDVGLWLRWGFLVALVLLQWWQSGKKDPITIPPPPVDNPTRIVFVHANASGSGNGCQCIGTEKK